MATTEWIEITKDNLPSHLLICEWKHPEYGIIKGNIVVYQPEKWQHEETWWIYPDPDCEEGSQADIAFEEFTEDEKERLFAVLRELATDIESIAGVTFNQALSQIVSK